MQRTVLLISAALALSGCNLLPSGGPAGRSGSSEPVHSAPRSIAVTPQARQCLAQLGETGSRFSAIPDKYYGAGCSTINAVNLTALQGDRSPLSVANLGPVTCPTAEALSGWARYGVDRAARQILGSPLRQIETMGSYACRNVAGSSRRSAHATAEAIDVAAFVLQDGRRISVLKAWDSGSSAERRFLRVIQQSACKRFGTVLGPEYNAAHRDHFHLEWSDSSFCR